MNKPRYNRCDSCGRNAHKVAIRVPVMERNPNWKPSNTEPFWRKTGRTEVKGYCPSCCPSVVREGETVIYDRRSDRSKAQNPMTVEETPVFKPTGNETFPCGHKREFDINGNCYTCGGPTC